MLGRSVQIFSGCLLSCLLVSNFYPRTIFILFIYFLVISVLTRSGFYTGEGTVRRRQWGCSVK